MGVVVNHAALDLDRIAIAPGALQHFDVGAAGVDLFFIISGFVMVYASEPLFGSSRGALTFFCHRLIRIVPLYWIVTAFALTLAMMHGYGTMYSFHMIAGSFLFVPTLRPEGVMQPVVSQGWTLNYEMFFYVIFAIAITAPRQTAVVIASTALILAVAFGRLYAPLPDIVAFWTNPIVLEFVLGMLLGLVYRKGARLNSPISIALIIMGFVLLGLSGFVGLTQRLFAWGVPAALVVAGASLGKFSLRSAVWHALAVIGNASYALYLLHAYPLRALAPVASWLSFHMAHWLWFYFFVTIAASVILAVLVHYTFERPVTKTLRRYATFARSPRYRSDVDVELVPAEWKSS